MLVIDEFADTWELPKKPNGYQRYFEAHWESDLSSMLARDFNHPSVIMVVAWYDGIDSVAKEDVVLTHVSRFYIPTDVDNKVPTQNLNTALKDGSNTTRGWRKDAGGRVFWGTTEITPIFLRDGRLQGYAHLTSETKTISDAVLS